MPVGIHIGLRRRRRAAAGPATDAAVSGVRADGWSIDFTNPPTMQPETAPRHVALSRQGFNPSGAPAAYNDVLILTQRVRLPYPGQSSLDAARVALSDYVYATDAILGGSSPPNGSTESSPKPIARWARADRRVVTSVLTLDIVACHRDARSREQIAAVKFTVTDGASTLTQVVAQSSVLGGAGDRNPITGYAAAFDISSLADGQITANAEVFPWLGGAASVLKSADSAPGARAFCPQVFRKGAARPVLYAYVDTTGNDATGVASVTAATASATPCLTVAGAMAKIRAADGATITDGHVIRLKAGTQAIGAPAAVTHSGIGELVIEADPTAGTTPVFALTGNWNSRHAYLRLRNLTVARTTTAQITGTFVTFENCTYQNSGAAITVNGGTSIFRWEGCVFTGATSAALAPTASAQHHLVRGMAIDAAATLDPFCSLGNLLINAGHSPSTQNESGFIGFNRFNLQAGAAVTLGTGGNVDGFGILQNLVEYTSTVSTAPAFRLSGDGNVGSVTHLVCHHNTITGYVNAGRGNILYSDTAATGRAHKLCSFVGNIHAQINTKHDVFATTAGNVNAWAYLYGVGCRGEFSQFIDASSGGVGSAFAQAYPGLKAAIGASATVRNDPLFVTYRGTVSASVAGAGGGDYRLQAGSTALGRVAQPVLRFDLAGGARPAADNASGAYLAA